MTSEIDFRRIGRARRHAAELVAAMTWGGG